MKGTDMSSRLVAEAVPSLEDMIRAAAAAGELTHLSLCPVAGKGANNIGWSASFSPGSAWGSGFGAASDPIEAIKLAMTDQRLGKTVRKIDKVLAETAPGDLAAVLAAAATKKTRKPRAPKPPAVDDSDFLGE